MKTKPGLVMAILMTVFSLTFLGAVLWPAFGFLRWTLLPKVPCVIERAGISADRNRQPEFQPDLRFRFSIDGVEHVGTRLWANAEGDRSYEVVAEALEEIGRSGSECRVDPDSPAHASFRFRPTSLWHLLPGAVMSGFFAAIGITMLLSSLARRKDTNWDGRIAKIAVSFFATIGGVMLIFWGITILLPAWRARNWPAVPAEVIWSRMTTDGSGRRLRHYADIHYRYEYAGAVHYSNRYELFDGALSDKQERSIAAFLKPGQSITCHVNPEKPWRAVVDRRIGGNFWLFLFFLPFLAFGVFGFRSLAKSDRQNKPHRPTLGGAKKRSPTRRPWR